MIPIFCQALLSSIIVQLSMRVTYFASPGRIWDRMRWEARLQFLQAVFFTGSGVGFLLDLANPRPGRTAHIVFLVFMGGAIGVAYGFCFLRTPKLLPIPIAPHCSASHHNSFKPNWIWREVVEVAVITPAVGEGPPVEDAYTTGFGVLKFV